MTPMTNEERRTVQRTLLHTTGGKLLLRRLHEMVLDTTLGDETDRIAYNSVRVLLNDFGIGVVFARTADGPPPAPSAELTPHTYDEQLGLTQERTTHAG